MAYPTLNPSPRTALVIEKAAENGWTVREGYRDSGSYNPILCAGSLKHCLTYIETQAWPADVWQAPEAA